ncbi:MAG: sigma factor [Verrucomicrobiales bacterium]
MTEPTHPLRQSESPKLERFPETRWSLVVAAADAADEPAAKRALGELCAIYWYPVYSFFRGRGESPGDAEDLTQEFFAAFIRRRSVETVAPERGKLRAFLLASAKNFLVSEKRKEQTQKRGGGAVPVSIDMNLAEGKFAGEPRDPAANPEEEFDRAWARTLIGRVRDQMGESYVAAGKAELAAALLPYLDAGDEPPYRDLARQTGQSAGALRVAVFRMRHKYRTLLKQEIADTLADSADLDGEISYLVGLFGR